MKRDWVRLQLRFKAPKILTWQMASRRSVLGGSALSIVTFLVLYTKKTKMVRTDTIDGL